VTTSTAGPSASVDPGLGPVWRQVRGPVLVLLLVLAAGVALAAAGGSARSGLLDPRATDPSGSRALAQVLRQQGVEVRLVTRTARLRAEAARGGTVLVAFPQRLVDSQVAAVRGTGADLVLVGAAEPERFAPAVRVARPVAVQARSPVCRLPAAARAGRADTGGVTYTVRGGGADLCYAEEGDASLVQVRSGGRTVTLLGDPTPLTNRHLDEEGNAALALGLLGARPRLLWYLPSLDDVPPSEARSFYALVPPGLWWGLGQVLVAVLLLALWRARRLGPVVTEPLPVVVRAAEVVEGRARLYRRAGARQPAAEALRAALRARLLPLLGLPRRAEPDAVVHAVAARSGRPGAEVAALLYGAAPRDDAALVRLADDLDALERQVRRP
jgi:hypothetical protein